ncbi:flagellar basal-body rod protein FlgF [Spirochaeta cellobiosiphila]|uniref:flagellar basal-body rod protein FlgF n=1 Tax=Spirochaeta cellobiosiphila TaxID=504483 RepID=UPI00040E6CB2|nr:flagellar basal-body rod protein FlgF [Spirochaeta cellobiosiphila]
MVRGIYTGASGMVAQMHRMDTISNNLANVDTTGYKMDESVHKAFPQMLMRRVNDNGLYKFPLGSFDTAPVVGMLGTGVEQNESYTIFSQGSLKQTENPFDLSLEDKGFFSIQTPRGERYTRNGSFVLGKEGLLLTKEGYPVLGENGPISIKANNFVVDKKGRIWENKTYADNANRLVSMEENDWDDTGLVDTLKIVDFAQTRYLRKQGSSLWAESENSGEPETFSFQDRPGVQQGFIEAANVNPVTEMVQMIEVNRAYEANQKVIQSEDSMTNKLINEAVRL